MRGIVKISYSEFGVFKVSIPLIEAQHLAAEARSLLER